MAYIFLFIFVLAFWFSVCFRVAAANPISTVSYAVKDFYHWLKYREWRNCGSGVIRCYAGLFGKGKTLSAVHHVASMYRKYDGRTVWDPSRHAWVLQRVHIISNVELAVPHEKFVSLSQIVSAAETMRRRDRENGTLTVTLVLGDEFSVQLNSRSFKTNIDPLFLNALLTCRHHHISLFYTSQRFGHVDALLRQVTSSVITCGKCWRFMVHGEYDAFALENAADPLLVKPLRRFGWFIRDRDFAAYDTLACVESLAKSCREGDMMSEEEILALQRDGGPRMEAVAKPSRLFTRNQRKMRK